MLSEEVYQTVPSATDFVQSEPNAGEPATQKTEVWIFFDNDNFYLTTKCWESNLEGMIVNEMRRDAANIGQNERIGFTLDTFYDRRNGVSFSVNPIGGRMDGQITDERQYNSDWNPIWDLAVGRFDGGWTVEAQIPFKSLRYRPGPRSGLGHQRQPPQPLEERDRATSRAMPPALRGLFQISMAATLVGLEVPSGSRNLEIKPYVTGDVTSVRRPDGMLDSEPGADAGLDVKYGLTQNLTADLTYNTDFAQVEADEQQVNLTRFSLFFPEKREFFLENQGTFAFGGAPATGQAVGGGDMPVLFYSRQDRVRRRARGADHRRRPAHGPRRTLHARALLNIQSDDEPSARALATNFSVRAGQARSSSAEAASGVLFTGRSVDADRRRARTRRTASTATFAFYDNLAINTYWARTATTGAVGRRRELRAQLDYAGDRYGLQLERLVIGDHFNPEVGFVRRDNMRRNFGLLRFSPRPLANRLDPQVLLVGPVDYIENGGGRLETRDLDGDFAHRVPQRRPVRHVASRTSTSSCRPFPHRDRSHLPVGGYDFAAAAHRIHARTASARVRQLRCRVTAASTAARGRRSSSRAGGSNVTPQFSIEPSVIDELGGSAGRAVHDRVWSARASPTR